MKRNFYPMRHQWLHNNSIGQIKPCFVQEVTPGDTWQGKSVSIHRLAPLDYPAYMQLKVYTKFFYVPHRLTFPEFPEVFAGTDTSTPWPTITYSSSDIWAIFGVPVNTLSTPAMNALPLRAWNLVYNTYFRNASIEAERSLDAMTVQRCRFPQSDYFGGMIDEIQQGSEVTVDTSGATLGVTAIRDAMNEQRWRERRAVYGERYRDVLRTDYGVKVSDRSIDRPEYLCGNSSVMGISEVVATATSASEETGEIRGHGITGHTIRFKPRYFEEPGIIIGVQYARPRLTLNTGRDHIYKLSDVEDLYKPSNASDTYVAVTSDEVFFNNTTYSNFAYTHKDDWLRKPRDVVASSFLGNTGWYANVELTSTPTMSYLQQVQEYDSMFQDQTAARMDIMTMNFHQIGKKSLIRRIPKR